MPEALRWRWLPYVSRLEQGRKNPTVELLASLANALDADVVELLKPEAKRGKQRRRTPAQKKPRNSIRSQPH